jgi:FixJ family two-component response regulator
VVAVTLVGIVDDDRSLCSSLVRLVRSMGYEARGFESAEEFMRSSTLDECSCLITDVQMPGISGIELAKFMTVQRSTVPVIVVTAHAEPGLEDSALANGASYFLRKPIDGDLLAANLSKVITSQVACG